MNEEEHAFVGRPRFEVRELLRAARSGDLPAEHWTMCRTPYMEAHMHHLHSATFDEGSTFAEGYEIMGNLPFVNGKNMGPCAALVQSSEFI